MSQNEYGFRRASDRPQNQSSANGKDYSDDIEAFRAGLKNRSDFDLRNYRQNLVRAAARITGNDTHAHNLFQKLTLRAECISYELNWRDKNPPNPSLFKYASAEERKRKLELLERRIAKEEHLDCVRGASADDPPIETKRTTLAPPDFRSLEPDQKRARREDSPRGPIEGQTASLAASPDDSLPSTEDDEPEEEKKKWEFEVDLVPVTVLQDQPSTD